MTFPSQVDSANAHMSPLQGFTEWILIHSRILIISNYIAKKESGQEKESLRRICSKLWRTDCLGTLAVAKPLWPGVLTEGARFEAHYSSQFQACNLASGCGTVFHFNAVQFHFMLP